jgi:hypothetical protein
MTAATFDHQVGKSLEFFEQQRNENTACARFIRALYFEALAESRMRLEADPASAQTESRPRPARLDRVTTPIQIEKPRFNTLNSPNHCIDHLATLCKVWTRSFMCRLFPRWRKSPINEERDRA